MSWADFGIWTFGTFVLCMAIFILMCALIECTTHSNSKSTRIMFKRLLPMMFVPAYLTLETFYLLNALGVW